MKSRKLLKPTKKDKSWQKKIEKRVSEEKIELAQPNGKERFERVIRKLIDNAKR